MTTVTPIGWTAEDEVEYQAYLKKLQAQIDAAGPNDDIAMVRAALLELSDPTNGRAYYLKAKGNGWL